MCVIHFVQLCRAYMCVILCIIPSVLLYICALYYSQVKKHENRSQEDKKMKKIKIEEMVKNTRWFVTFEELNSKGEEIVVEFVRCTNPGGNNSLPYLWKKNGFINRILENWWNIQVYVTDSDGRCRGAYNPTSKLSEDGKRMVINFAWMLEATEENAKKLFDEVERLAFME
nr:MAG TPA: hypothetical protein [Caudoviricetes sp.]